VALAPGTRLGPYEVIAQIGAGGMGEVYRARDTKLNRDVALKQQRPRLSTVTVTTMSSFTLTNPTSFELKRLSGDLVSKSEYDVLPDGRFIYRASASDRPAPAPVNPPIQVVLNWFTELQQRVPVK
jgi:hypothetical protein